MSESNEVIGVAVRGASDPTLAKNTDRYGVIPAASVREFLARAAMLKAAELIVEG
jgi:hypothetical protein